MIRDGFGLNVTFESHNEPLSFPDKSANPQILHSLDFASLSVRNQSKRAYLQKQLDKNYPSSNSEIKADRKISPYETLQLGGSDGMNNLATDSTDMQKCVIF